MSATQSSGSDDKSNEKKDLTKERQKLCEPIVNQILQLLLDKNVLLKNLPYIEQKVQADLETYFQNIVPHLVMDSKNIIFDMIQKSLEISVNQAIDLLWEKSREDVTTGDVQRIFDRTNAQKKIPNEK